MKNIKLARKYFSQIDSSLRLYFNNFDSVEDVNVEKLLDLLHTREYLIGQYYMSEGKYEDAEKVFESLRDNIREELISTQPYCFLTRRLGILKIYNNKVNEAIMHFQNIYEYSKELEDDWYYIYGLDLIITALKNNPLKALFLINMFDKERANILSCDGEKQLKVNYYTNLVYFANSNKTFEEYKSILKRYMNITNDTDLKAAALHNLAVILYYEIKTHNKFIDEYEKKKKLLAESKEYPLIRSDEDKYDIFI